MLENQEPVVFPLHTDVLQTENQIITDNVGSDNALDEPIQTSQRNVVQSNQNSQRVLEMNQSITNMAQSMTSILQSKTFVETIKDQIG